jgi:hypothetical protein
MERRREGEGVERREGGTKRMLWSGREPVPEVVIEGDPKTLCIVKQPCFMCGKIIHAICYYGLIVSGNTCPDCSNSKEVKND